MVYVERDVEKKVRGWLEEREILLVRGPRQCGKTTLLIRIKDILKDKNVDEGRIHYINFEDDLVRLKFEENAKEFIGFYLASKGKNYFLLDEVQYVKDVGKNLKLIFDSFENIKIIATGSSSFDLTTLGSYLVGRVIFFDLYPFSFHEFLRSKGSKYENLYKSLNINLTDKKLSLRKTVFLGDLNKFLHEYLTYGSYPRVVLESDKERKGEILKNLFTTYIEKDVVGLYGKEYRERAVRLLKILAAITGDVVNFETLSSVSGLKYKDVRNVLPLLVDSFVISVIPPFHKNLVSELRKNPKIYFVDYGIRNYLLGRFENIAFDNLYENFVYNQLRGAGAIKYWRTTAKTEVDFVIEAGNKIIPVEVKTKPKITRSFQSFIKEYKPGGGFLLNLNIVGKTKVNGCTVLSVPFVYV